MINKNSILLIDPTFELENANSCDLLIKVGLDSFSYTIINNIRNKVIALYNEQECEDGFTTYKDRLKSDVYLSLDYQEIKIAIFTPNSISIPNELYTEEHLSLNTKYFAEETSKNLYSYAEPYFGFTTIFSIQENLDNAINFTASTKYPENAGLLNFGHGINEDALVIDFAVTSASIIYITNNKIIFQQSYQIVSDDEFNYYLLLIQKQLRIGADSKIYVSGVIHENEKLYNCIKKYFNEIIFLTINQDLDQQILDDMPAHYFSSLLALNECG